MLDFYIIKDDQSKPNFPEQGGLKFIGGLNDIVFENLQRKGVLSNRFDYYSDFRLGTSLITQIRQNISQKQMQDDSDVKQLLHLFEAAEKLQSGLIAYAD